MGNSIPQGGSSSPRGTGKVILSDGRVHYYDKPLTVAELMLEYPQERVFEVGKKPAAAAPLPADSTLEKDKIYVMIPVRRGGKPAALSSEEASRILWRANCFLQSKSSLLSSYTGFFPVFARMMRPPSGGVVATVKGGPRKQIVQWEADGKESKTDYFAEILAERPDYLSRQLSGKTWKPSLDTIKEKSFKAKIRHWLF